METVEVTIDFDSELKSSIRLETKIGAGRVLFTNSQFSDIGTPYIIIPRRVTRYPHAHD